MFCLSGLPFFRCFQLHAHPAPRSRRPRHQGRRPEPRGANYQLPSLSVRLKSGRRGVVVETRLKGTSYDDPGLTLQAKIKWKLVTITSPVSCFPDPNPALTRTVVR
ncbi:hypothetical protein AB0F43_36180 [Kribbella sp. NPDC023972]|uniref:hypothetical protein n=1 Tax=Kribbella sp. NPDC023972 TaxID=3154795 RepID=UPI0033C6FA7F